MNAQEAAWQAVLARPRDERARQVLADALSEAGDPLGEFIALQLSNTVDLDAVNEHLATHVERFLGAPERLFQWNVRFSRGFVAQAGPLFEPADLERMLTLPIGRLVELLQLEFAAPEAVALFRRHPPVALVELVLRVSTQPPSTLVVREVLDALPRLERLLDFHGTVDLTGASSSALRVLSLLVGSHVVGLGEASLPALESLVMTLPFRRVDLDPRFLLGEVTPKLSTLVLFGALWPTQLEALAASALLPKLKTLDLLTLTDTGWYPVLLRHASAFQHLDHLRVRPDNHHPEWVETLRTLFPQLTLVSAD